MGEGPIRICFVVPENIDSISSRSNFQVMIVYETHFQDNVRNQLIQFELILTTATFVVAIFGVVAGIFGMNFAISLFDKPGAFEWVLIITGVSGVIIFCSFLWFFRYRRLMPL